MLDTNIVSAIMRDPAGPTARRVVAQPEPVSVSIIVAAELRFGAARKGSARLTETLERVLGGLEIEPLSEPVDVIYGRLRDALERRGLPMDANDLLIAAHALALDRVLISADAAFTRVRGLQLENWLP
ncbi:type II toxin-antitoxin system VapC family toxin [soil metagenome]